MISPVDYRVPKTLGEACDLLGESGGKAKIIAGGTDLVVRLRNGELRPKRLIDLTGIAELRTIRENDGMISIGAAVTHAEIGSSPLMKMWGKVLADAASGFASPQIRNVGTIGGNIINASPAADMLPPLMVVGAVGWVVSREGEREVPLIRLFEGPYQTSLKPHEILAQISFQKVPPHWKGSFVKLARREAMAVTWMGVAILLQMDRRKGRIEDIRISLGAMTPIPNRISEVEDLLRGRTPDEALLERASNEVSEAMVRRSGPRSENAYKAPVVKALFLRALKEAAGGEA